MNGELGMRPVKSALYALHCRIRGEMQPHNLYRQGYQGKNKGDALVVEDGGDLGPEYQNEASPPMLVDEYDKPTLESYWA